MSLGSFPPSGKGDVQIVDLGPADAIEAAVAIKARERRSPCRRAECWTAFEKHGEIAAEKQTRDTFAKKCPISSGSRSSIESSAAAKRLTISPDGTLWLLPWSSLPVGKEKILDRRISVAFCRQWSRFAGTTRHETWNKQSRDLLGSRL